MNYKLQEIHHLAGRDIFFDANILIYLFWPTGRHYAENQYAGAFSKLLRQKNPLNIDFNVISEVINRIIRIEHQNSASHLPFKDFRDSPSGQEALGDLYTIINENILPYFNISEKSYSRKHIDSFLNVDSLDFNDKGTVALCAEKSYILLTNDRDFKNSGIDILTANNKILNN